MSDFDKSSQLPLGGSFCVAENIFVALVGNCPEEAIRTLEMRPEIAKVIPLPPDNLIDSPIKSHPDTILCIYKNSLYCHKKYAEENLSLLGEIASLTGLEISPQDVKRNGKYPYDISFNAVTFPNKDIIIGKKDSLCPPLAEVAVDSKQGYAACCSLTVGNTIITADISVIKAAESVGIDVYTVSGEDISLPGYDKGFVGGATGATENTVYIFGEPDSSKTGRELVKFCKKAEHNLVSLCSGKVTDYGGIKFVKMRNI